MKNLLNLFRSIVLAFLATVLLVGFVALVANLIVQPEAIAHATFGSF